MEHKGFPHNKNEEYKIIVLLPFWNFILIMWLHLSSPSVEAIQHVLLWNVLLIDIPQRTRQVQPTWWGWNSRKEEGQLFCTSSFLLCGNPLCSMWCCACLDIGLTNLNPQHKSWNFWMQYIQQPDVRPDYICIDKGCKVSSHCYCQWIMECLERDKSIHSWFISRISIIVPMIIFVVKWCNPSTIEWIWHLILWL